MGSDVVLLLESQVSIYVAVGVMPIVENDLVVVLRLMRDFRNDLRRERQSVFVVANQRSTLGASILLFERSWSYGHIVVDFAHRVFHLKTRIKINVQLKKIDFSLYCKT